MMNILKVGLLISVPTTHVCFIFILLLHICMTNIRNQISIFVPFIAFKHNFFFHIHHLKFPKNNTY